MSTNPIGTSAHRPAAASHSGWQLLRVGLGVLWLVDAGLQLQPGMFHPAFFGQLPDSTMPSVLQSVAESSVHWVQPAVVFTQFLYRHAPIATNLCVTLIQLWLAAVLLLPYFRSWISFAAIGSIVWGLVIWVFGEGLGGLFSPGDMTFYTGFPGPALFYAAAGGLLLIGQHKWDDGMVGMIMARSLGGILAVCAVLQLWPGNHQWETATLMSIFANSGFQPQPVITSAPVMAYSLWISDHTETANNLLTVLLVLGAVSAWTWRRSFLWSRIYLYVWLFWTWWFATDFGYVFSGLSTDLSTVPIFALIVTWKSVV